MTAADDNLQMLEKLRVRFRARCRDDLAILEQGPGTEQFAYCVHRLAGSAGTFGFDDISRNASQIDDQFRQHHTVEQKQLDQLISLVRSIL
jgi:HPt (histidine-containing phosphotransfer) domain-containing protein